MDRCPKTRRYLFGKIDPFGCMALDVAPSGAHHFYGYGCYKDLAPTEPVLGSAKNRVEKNRLTFFYRKQLRRSRFSFRRRRTETIMNRTSLLGSRASVTSSQQSASQSTLKRGCL